MYECVTSWWGKGGKDWNNEPCKVQILHFKWPLSWFHQNRSDCKVDRVLEMFMWEWWHENSVGHLSTIKCAKFLQVCTNSRCFSPSMYALWLERGREETFRRWSQSCNCLFLGVLRTVLMRYMSKASAGVAIKSWYKNIKWFLAWEECLVQTQNWSCGMYKFGKLQRQRT